MLIVVAYELGASPKSNPWGGLIVQPLPKRFIYACIPFFVITPPVVFCKSSFPFSLPKASNWFNILSIEVLVNGTKAKFRLISSGLFDISKELMFNNAAADKTLKFGLFEMSNDAIF